MNQFLYMYFCDKLYQFKTRSNNSIRCDKYLQLDRDWSRIPGQHPILPERTLISLFICKNTVEFLTPSTCKPRLKEYSGQYSALIKMHIVTGNEKLCEIYFKNLFFSKCFRFYWSFYRYHYIRYFIYSDCMVHHVCTICIYGSSHWKSSLKKMFLKVLLILQESTCFGVSFLIKLQVWGPAALLKRDFNTDVFLWN